MNIPYLSQWDLQANLRITDCGPTCVAMWLLYRLGKSPTVNALSLETPSLRNNDKGTSPEDIADLLTQNGLTADVRIGITLATIESEIDAKRPVILLIQYGPISEREDKNDVLGNHWILAVDYDADFIYVNDPDMSNSWLGGREKGLRLPIPKAELTTALQHAVYPFTGVFESIPGPVLSNITAGLAYTVEADVRLRNTPNGLPILATLPLNTAVNVLSTSPVKSGGYIWVNVQYGSLKGWIADVLLTKTAKTPTFPIGYATVASAGGLNIRATPGGMVIGVLADGATISVLQSDGVKNGGHTYVKVGYGNIVGYAASEYIRFNANGMFGVHIMGTVDLAAVRGMTYGVYKSMDDPGSIIAARQAHPNAICIYRKYRTDNPDEYIGQSGGMQNAINRHMQEMAPLFQMLPMDIYIESWNEMGAGSLYCEFERLRSIAYAAIGRKVCILNISSGTSDKSLWATAAAAVHQTIINKGYVGIHAYAQTVMSANCQNSQWNQDGSWSGDLFPEITDRSSCYTALRCLQDKVDLLDLGLGQAALVATELGLDDMGVDGNNAKGGVFYPALHGKITKTRGWRECIPIWQQNGWLVNTTPEAFYRKMLQWWSVQSGIPGVVYTYGTNDPRWASYNVVGVL